MSNLSEIEIKIEEKPTAQIVAVLNEIKTLLKNLNQNDETNSIDIRSLPLFPGDYAILKSLLGEGEIYATLHALGPSTIQETRVPGVWWITHFNENEEKLAEYIEVTRLPAILNTTEEDLKESTSAIEHLIDSFLHNQQL